MVSGTESAVGGLTERHRRELRVHCYRMPTAASYRRRRGDTEFRAFKFDVQCTPGAQRANRPEAARRMPVPWGTRPITDV